MNSEELTHYDPQTRRLLCRGNWDLENLPKLQAIFDSIGWPKTGEIKVDGSGIHKMDTAGAWFLEKYEKQFKQQGINFHLENFPEKYTKLLSIVERKVQKEIIFPKAVPTSFLEFIGSYTYQQYVEIKDYLEFVGVLTADALRILLKPKHWRITSIATIIYRNGFQALPIIALLSLMIGIVLAYQLGLQLRTYGANIYIIDLIGLATLREFAPLLTAIMVAGRTGSSFTAQLGMMKINQEIDALNTLGVTPAELLLLPRIMGLVIALPLLTMWANIFGVLGAMIMANNMLDITYHDFIYRFPHVIPLKTLIIGLGKTPIFALIIASIGCFQGVQVQGSAESVGRNTTRSVVLAIFFIIVADAVFSIIFSKLKL